MLKIFKAHTLKIINEILSYPIFYNIQSYFTHFKLRKYEFYFTFRGTGKYNCWKQKEKFKEKKMFIIFKWLHLNLAEIP